MLLKEKRKRKGKINNQIKTFYIDSNALCFLCIYLDLRGGCCKSYLKKKKKKIGLKFEKHSRKAKVGKGEGR